MRDDNTTVVDRPSDQKGIWRLILPLLLLFLLGIGLLYYFMNKKDNDAASITETNTSTSTTPSSDTQGNSGTITELSTLLATSDASSLIGKTVSLPSPTVDTVIGDKSFTLGSSTDHVYAILSDKLDAGQTEQAVRVKAGETRSIQGTVIKAPSDMANFMSQFQLSQDQADELKSQGFYISVDQTAVVDDSQSDTPVPTGEGTE